ncbi:hypothetical protein SAMN05421819_1212 [Bryocella elongata]|uniref:XrtJ-associated TM-motif-TM protein n=1 Tax=Bryocella elongata TaxID=863522 RepID=A0A1H5UUT5_9BACT|nr:hypothetical protein [Bryocella elongata]SEF78823.1 hypothetical protein SAMN05421819_1212 [Bryocella elongata]
MKNKRMLQLCVIVLLAGMATRAHAIGGCDESPELPTDVLFSFAVAAFGGVELLRRRSSRK